MGYERSAAKAAEALTMMSHAFTRLANAQQRIANAAEEANELTRLREYAAQTDPIVLPAKGTEADPCPDDWDTNDD